MSVGDNNGSISTSNGSTVSASRNAPPPPSSSSGSSTGSSSNSSPVQTYKVYEAMFRVIKESENVDERQHCFLIQTAAGQESRYFSMETRAELLRLESAWHRTVCSTISQLGVSSFVTLAPILVVSSCRRFVIFQLAPEQSSLGHESEWGKNWRRKSVGPIFLVADAKSCDDHAFYKLLWLREST